MSRSIISNECECLICKTTRGLHRHHIFFGTANRKKSEEYGCWCYLCYRHHLGSNFAVHYNHDLDLRLKRLCQRKWEQKYGDRADFIKVFGKSWIVGDKDE